MAFQSINTVNWKAFPYQPEVQFRIAHTDDAILVHYKVKEASAVSYTHLLHFSPMFDSGFITWLDVLPCSLNNR